MERSVRVTNQRIPRVWCPGATTMCIVAAALVRGVLRTVPSRANGVVRVAKPATNV